MTRMSAHAAFPAALARVLAWEAELAERRLFLAATPCWEVKDLRATRRNPMRPIIEDLYNQERDRINTEIDAFLRTIAWPRELAQCRPSQDPHFPQTFRCYLDWARCPKPIEERWENRYVGVRYIRGCLRGRHDTG